MNKIVTYDEKNDILAIHKGFSRDEKFKSNIDTGDLILDVSTRGRIRGIEIINASRFLKEFNVAKNVLNELKDAQFNAEIKPNGIIIGLIFKTKHNETEIPAKVAVPLSNPAYAELTISHF